MKELINLFNAKLDEKQDSFGGGSLRTTIPDDSINAVILNMDFFQNIPKEDMPTIFDDLLELILVYNNIRTINRWYTEAKNNNGQVISSKENMTIAFDKIKPSQKINKFLKTIKDYQASIEELFNGYDFVDEKTYDNLCEMEEFKYICAPKEIGRNYINNKKIIEDLEKQEFKIIPKCEFYGIDKSSKIELKTFLKHIREKYKLKTSLSEKQLIDLI